MLEEKKVSNFLEEHTPIPMRIQKTNSVIPDFSLKKE
jgi:hypothetical protein